MAITLIASLRAFSSQGRQHKRVPFRNSLSETTIHSILQNQRRRYVLEYLRSEEQQTSIRDVVDWITEREADESPPPTGLRDSVYVSLHQTHLPTLDEAGVIDYDRNRKTISRREAARSVDLYMDVTTKYGLPWAAHYLGLVGLSLVVVVAAAIGVPGFTWLAPTVWAICSLVLILGFGAYQYGSWFRPALQRPIWRH